MDALGTTQRAILVFQEVAGSAFFAKTNRAALTAARDAAWAKAFRLLTQSRLNTPAAACDKI